MKSATLALLFLTATLPAGDMDTKQFTEDLVAFHEAYNVFFRDYFGCPKGATDSRDCEPARSRINYAAFARAQKFSKKVFQ